MSESIAWVAFFHTALFCAAWGYARFLDQPWVHALYSPDYVSVTVIGGDILIWPFVAALYWVGFPWWLNALFYITLHCAAGLPIVHWQRKRAEKRRADLEAL